MRTKRCERCPDEDTEACNGCKKVMKDLEDKLTLIIAKEEERIRGD